MNDLNSPRAMENDIEIIESSGIDPDDKFEIFTLPNGKKITIGTHDLSFFRKLQSLPARTKIEMMLLTEDELQGYIDLQRKLAKLDLIVILNQKWFWRETGDIAIITKDLIPGIEMSADEIKKKLLSKRSIPLSEIRKIIDFYTGSRSEVYNENHL